MKRGKLTICAYVSHGKFSAYFMLYITSKTNMAEIKRDIIAEDTDKKCSFVHFVVIKRMEQTVMGAAEKWNRFMLGLDDISRKLFNYSYAYTLMFSDISTSIRDYISGKSNKPIASFRIAGRTDYRNKKI